MYNVNLSESGVDTRPANNAKYGDNHRIIILPIKYADIIIYRNYSDTDTLKITLAELITYLEAKRDKEKENTILEGANLGKSSGGSAEY